MQSSDRGEFVDEADLRRVVPKSSRDRNNQGQFIHSDGPKYYDWLLEIPEIKAYASRAQAIDTLRSIMATFSRTLANKEEATKMIELAKSANTKGFRSFIVPKMQALNRAGKGHYSIRIGVTLKAFYNFINDLDSRDEGALRFRKGEVPKYKPKRTPNQHVPSPEEVYRMADIVGATPFMGPRNKAVMLFLFQSGCRSGVLSNLTYGDVAPCLDGYCSHDHPLNGPRGMKLPIYLKITENMDTKIRGYDLTYFWTFIGLEAATALQEYIKFRMRPNPAVKRFDKPRRLVSHSDWKPEDDDILFMSTQGNPINHFSICDIMNLGADGIGIDRKHIWPHLLRKSFRKVIRNSDEVDDDWRHAVMGWSMFGVHKHYYDELDVTDAARMYASCDFTRMGRGRIEDKIKAQDQRIQELEIKNQKLTAQLIPQETQTKKTFSEQFLDELEDPEFLRRMSKLMQRKRN